MHSKPQHDLWFYIGTTPMAALAAIITTVTMYALFMLLSRMMGQRILARLSSFDLLVVIAMGSIIGRTMVGMVTTLTTGVIVLITLLICEAILGAGAASRRFSTLLHNQPVLLMAGEMFLEHEMKRCHITRQEIIGALRRAGVRNRGEVAAVILETTGDLAVLKRGDTIEQEMLEGVRSAEHMPIDLLTSVKTHTQPTTYQA